MPCATVDLPLPEVPAIRITLCSGSSVSSRPSGAVPRVRRCRINWLARRREVVAQPFVDQFGHARAMVGCGDEVGGILEGGQGIGHCGGHLAMHQEGMVVFRIAHADGVVRGKLHRGEGCRQTGGLVDARRQHHHRALVEDHLQLQPQLVDGGKHRRLVGLPCGDDGVSDGQRRHVPIAQRLNQRLRGRLRQQLDFARRGSVQHGAVLGHDPLEQVQARKDALQIFQLAARDQDEMPAGGDDALQRSDGRVIDRAVMRDRAVVVARQCKQPHRPRGPFVHSATGARAVPGPRRV